jgi:hypothetical protein
MDSTAPEQNTAVAAPDTSAAPDTPVPQTTSVMDYLSSFFGSKKTEGSQVVPTDATPTTTMGGKKKSKKSKKSKKGKKSKTARKSKK